VYKKQDILESKLTAYVNTGDPKHVIDVLRIQDELFDMMTDGALRHLESQIQELRQHTKDRLAQGHARRRELGQNIQNVEDPAVPASPDHHMDSGAAASSDAEQPHGPWRQNAWIMDETQAAEIPTMDLTHADELSPDTWTKEDTGAVEVTQATWNTEEPTQDVEHSIEASVEASIGAIEASIEAIEHSAETSIDPSSQAAEHSPVLPETQVLSSHPVLHARPKFPPHAPPSVGSGILDHYGQGYTIFRNLKQLFHCTLHRRPPPQGHQARSAHMRA